MEAGVGSWLKGGVEADHIKRGNATRVAEKDWNILGRVPKSEREQFAKNKIISEGVILLEKDQCPEEDFWQGVKKATRGGLRKVVSLLPKKLKKSKCAGESKIERDESLILE